LALDESHTTFFTPRTTELHDCIRIDETYFCNRQQTLLKAKGDHCILTLFYSRQDIRSCTDRFVKIKKELWIQLASPNTWLYVLPEMARVTIICQKAESSFLNGVGILRVDENCRILTERTTLYPHNDFKVDTKLSFSTGLGAYNFTSDQRLSWNSHIPELEKIVFTAKDGENLEKFGRSLHELRKIDLQPIASYFSHSKEKMILSVYSLSLSLSYCSGCSDFCSILVLLLQVPEIRKH
jgi:hypothetical protein